MDELIKSQISKAINIQLDDGFEENVLEVTTENIADEDLQPAIEAMLLANGEPLGTLRISEILEVKEECVIEAILKIQKACVGHGFELVNIAGQYQYRTRSQYARFVQALQAIKPRRLSHAALETLAIVAYRQPVLKADIEKIRGVDATPTLKTLLDKNLVKIVGHKEAVGQPALYGTGEEFLKLFGMSGLTDLPTLRELKEFGKDPGENTLGEKINIKEEHEENKQESSSEE